MCIAVNCLESLGLTLYQNISSFSGDLSSLTAPPFILSSTSLTEYSAYWVSHPDLLKTIPQEGDPQKRAALVLKWFLSTLKSQYSSRNEKLGSEKKPLNPFLGELFLGKWEAEDGDLKLVSEQVSHHPPVTAYAISDTKDSVLLQGYNGQKASISKTLSITVKQIGHAMLRFPQRKTKGPDGKEEEETYLITLPSLHIEGLLSGAPFVELDGSSSIVSNTGFVSQIEYTGRGWISGKKNSFSATLSSVSSPKKPIYQADGQWTGSFCIRDASTKETIVEYNPADLPIVPLTVANIEDQDEMESRRAWQKVALAIHKGDMDEVGREKGLIENSQRDLRKAEKEENREWARKYFARQKEDEVYERLAKKLPHRLALEADKTDGVWVYVSKGKSSASK
jgi:hypothetical protein